MSVEQTHLEDCCSGEDLFRQQSVPRCGSPEEGCDRVIVGAGEGAEARQEQNGEAAGGAGE